ncbi:hypothetical protein ACOKM5_40755 [Streptomyces sp. BH097]|uniref:hypothetical protein n=1 Tax=unclassified Streptomyces TaxID=2593676 RepID=UPI003BB5BBA7
MTREDKWLVVALGGMAVSTASQLVNYTGWARVFWVALGLFAMGSLSWQLRRDRRKRRARRQEWLTHFDRLLRDEVRRR